jgi:alkanesulfonate monooxygenase SsuD/methylene tetrahydromethanopterin reductase-like flavin-dependent oxidoreductase (luciferase family)
VARFAEAFEIVRRLLAGERVAFDGAFHRVDDAVLLPSPARRPPLMVGANGRRMLELTLPHVDTWNTWFTPYGNRADGFARLNAGVDETCERVGRDPREVGRSACVLVRVGGGAGERPDDPDAPHLDAADLPAELDGFAQAGADEAILVLDPIDETSIRELGATLF